MWDQRWCHTIFLKHPDGKSRRASNIKTVQKTKEFKAMSTISYLFTIISSASKSEKTQLYINFEHFLHFPTRTKFKNWKKSTRYTHTHAQRHRVDMTLLYCQILYLQWLLAQMHQHWHKPMSQEAFPTNCTKICGWIGNKHKMLLIPSSFPI